MANFAQIDENNIVTNIIVVKNIDCQDDEGNHSEQVGVNFCKSLFSYDTNWVEVQSAGSTCNRLAYINDTYDAINDVFISPQPFSSWTLNQTTFNWEPPVAYPDDGNHYYWDEATTSWVLS